MKEQFWQLVIPMEMVAMFCVIFIVVFALKSHKIYRETGYFKPDLKFLVSCAGSALGFMIGLAASVAFWLNIVW